MEVVSDKSRSPGLGDTMGFYSTLKSNWPYALAGTAGVGLAAYEYRRIQRNRRTNAAIQEVVNYSNDLKANPNKYFAGLDLRERRRTL